MSSISTTQAAHARCYASLMKVKSNVRGGALNTYSKPVKTTGGL